MQTNAERDRPKCKNKRIKKREQKQNKKPTNEENSQQPKQQRKKERQWRTRRSGELKPNLMPMNHERNERLRTCAHEVHKYEILRGPKLARNDLAKTMTTKPPPLDKV